MVAGKLREASGYYTGEEQDIRNERGAEMIIMIHSFLNLYLSMGKSRT